MTLWNLLKSNMTIKSDVITIDKTMYKYFKKEIYDFSESARYFIWIQTIVIIGLISKPIKKNPLTLTYGGLTHSGILIFIYLN